MKQKKAAVFFFLAGLFVACGTSYTLTENNSGKLVDYSSVEPDARIEKIIGPYSDTCRTTMSKEVGYLAEDMEKGFPEGKLGNFMADIFLDRVLQQNKNLTADNTFALFNNGGLRVPLQKGAVTRGKVFELMPFENMLVGIKLKGRYLVHDLAAYLVSKKGQPLSRNVFVQFKGNQLVKMEINGVPVDTTREYVVLTSDYLSGGGDNMAFFKSGTPVETGLTVKLRDGIIDYLLQYSSAQQPLAAPALGRIKME